MPATEFEIIDRFFTWPAGARREILLAVGDDAAELELGSRRMLLDVAQAHEGQDFQPADQPAGIGHRLLAAALARLAARGAEPLGFTLALSLPDSDEAWLTEFSRGLAELARRYDVALIGGDTTRGPRAAVLHLHGALSEAPVPEHGAAPGDLVYVAGCFGDAAVAVLHLAGELQLPLPERKLAQRALEFPEPPSGCGAILTGLASSATAIADSLSQSLAHLLQRSGCGATVQIGQIPLGGALQARLEAAGGRDTALHGPAPAQLCFTLPAAAQAELERRDGDRVCSWIGVVERQPGLRLQGADGGA